MNDLAERALHGVATARRAVRARPLLGFGVVGFGLAVLVVVAGGMVAAAEPDRPLTSWLGLELSRGADQRRLAAAVLLAGALAALLLVWLAVAEYVRRTATPPEVVWRLAAAWGAPFAVGPPLLGTSVYSYAAFGLVQRRGHDPYHYPAGRLGDSSVVAAIDPAARGVPSGTGPLGTALQHLALSTSGGTALGAVIALRVLAVVAVIAVGRAATDLSGRRAAPALTLTVLNPLALLYLVSAARLDATMIALVLAALVAVTRRRWIRALVLAALGGSVFAVGFAVVPVIVALHLARRGRAPVWRVLVRDILVAAVVTVGIGLAVSDGFGWLTTVTKQFSAHTPFSVAGAVAIVLTPIVRGASYDDFVLGGRAAAVTAMACALVYLITTAPRRQAERTFGYALLAVALLAPVLHPWYLLWGVLCLAPTADGPRRHLVLAVSAAGCLLTAPGVSGLAGDLVVTGWLVAVAAVVAAGYLLGRRSATPAPTPVAAARDVSAAR